MQRIFGFIKSFAPLIFLFIIVVIATFFIENWLFLAGQRYHEVKPISDNDNGLIETLYINVKDINVNNGSMLFDIWAEAWQSHLNSERFHVSTEPNSPYGWIFSFANKRTV